jgi:hypothetical protein
MGMSDPLPVIPLQYAHVGVPLRSGKALRVLIVLAGLACLLAWALIVTIQAETVLGTGPLIFLLGVAMLAVAVNARSNRCMILGALHCAVCLLFFVVTWRLDWSPDEALKPFTLAGAVYIVLISFVSAWAWRGTR